MTEAQHPAYLWRNHRLVPWREATVHLADNWWAAVGAVFEGMRGYWNPEHGETYLFRLDDHLARLEDSMRLVRMAHGEFPPAELAEAARELVRCNEHRGHVYLMPLAYAVGGRSFGTAGDRETNVFITSRPTTSTLGQEHAVHVCYSSWTRIGERVLPPRVKALSNYRNSQLASAEADANGYDTALLLNEQGKVAEGPGSCVVFVRGGRLFTPDLGSGILESITRDCVIRIARELLGLEVEERGVDRTETYLADEAFLCGTWAEVTPIASIDRYPMNGGAPGPITAAIRDLYHALALGADPRFPEWRTPAGLAASDYSRDTPS